MMEDSWLQHGVEHPSQLMLLAEARVAWEAGSSLVLWPWLSLAPRGDGHTVLVLPGLGCSDATTMLLRRYLLQQGYDAHGWGLGTNQGPWDGVHKKAALLLERLHQTSGRTVSLVGWSLGGVFARQLAAQAPGSVRCVITLGSPFRCSQRPTSTWWYYGMASGRSVDDTAPTEPAARTEEVPTTSIFSRSDGVVPWRCSVDEETSRSENIEVFASHTGLGSHPFVLYVVAERLSQPEGAWRPFAAHPQPTRRRLGRTRLSPSCRLKGGVSG
jgi:pimeloyl-ACP methyl ester carboxylesterase